MPLKKGQPKHPDSGRKKGQLNKLTMSMKEMVQATLEGLGGAEGMKEWGRENRTEFYKIAAKLIPTDIKADLTGTALNITIRRFTPEPTKETDDGKTESIIKE